MKVVLHAGKELQRCPMCGAIPVVAKCKESVTIGCSRNACRSVRAIDDETAIQMWNMPMNHRTNFKK
jgi:hypothetical protein